MKAIRNRMLLIGAILPSLCSCGVSSSPQATQPEADREVHPATLYTVANYDAQRDPNQDLAVTVQKAAASGKRILLEIGGEW